ncbi:MAG: ABC transporter substrate-binding protein [Actinomycetota bacterium]
MFGRSTRSLRLLLMLLMALALFAASCGDSDDDSEAEADEGVTTAESEEAVDDSADDDDAAAADSDDEAMEEETAGSAPAGTLRMALTTDVQTYDPVMAGVAQTPYLQPVYDTLLVWTLDGVQPRQAEEFRLIDASTYELDIRPGITFSDGAVFDAAAVVASYERAIAREDSPQAAFYGNIASVTAPSDMTVRFELVEPTTVFLEDLTWLPGMVTSPNASDLDAMPAGAGGWVLDADSTRAGVQQDFVARTDGFWDPDSVLVERLEIRLLQDEAAVNAMLNDELDLSYRADNAVSDYEAAGLTILESPGPSLRYVQVMDLDGVVLEPIGNVDVRRAMMLALDRDGYNAAVQNGLGDPYPGWFLPGEPWHDPAAEQYAFDLEAAQQLLADAGYPDGFAITLETIPPLAPTAEAIQQMWTALGLDVTVNVGEPGTLADTMRSGTTPLTPTFNIGHPPETFYRQRLAPGSGFDPLAADRGEIADLAAAALEATTVEDQNAAWAAVFAYAVDQGFVMPYGHAIPGVVISDVVQGATVIPTNASFPRPYGISVG